MADLQSRLQEARRVKGICIECGQRKPTRDCLKCDGCRKIDISIRQHHDQIAREKRAELEAERAARQSRPMRTVKIGAQEFIVVWDGTA